MDEESDSVGSNEWPYYICKFCNKSFSKKQALGGHMNGHRQERQNEKYEKAKALLQQNSWMMNNQHVASIPGGVHTLVQNAGGGISGFGPSLPTSYLNQQQHYQVRERYPYHHYHQMRERYPYHHYHQMRERYPFFPYQEKNSLQIGGGASLVNNAGIRGTSLPMNSHLQIRGNPNLVVSGHAAAAVAASASASEQAILQHLPRLVQPSSATEERDEVISEDKTTVKSERI